MGMGVCGWGSESRKGAGQVADPSSLLSPSQALQPPQAPLALQLRSCLLPQWSRLLAQAAPYLRDPGQTNPTPPQLAPLTLPRGHLLSPLGTRSLVSESQLQSLPTPPLMPSRTSKH